MAVKPWMRRFYCENCTCFFQDTSRISCPICDSDKIREVYMLGLGLGIGSYRCESCGKRLTKEEAEECMGLCPDCRRDSLNADVIS